jgi:hypothetical protein
MSETRPVLGRKSSTLQQFWRATRYLYVLNTHVSVGNRLDLDSLYCVGR